MGGGSAAVKECCRRSAFSRSGAERPIFDSIRPLDLFPDARGSPWSGFEKFGDDAEGPGQILAPQNAAER